MPEPLEATAVRAHDRIKLAKQLSIDYSEELYRYHIGNVGRRSSDGVLLTEVPNPFRSDSDLNSSTYYIRDAKFCDYGQDAQQRDWLDFYVETGLASDTVEAADMIINLYGKGGGYSTKKTEKKSSTTNTWEQVTPIPQWVKEPSTDFEFKDSKGNTLKQVARWDYRDAEGRLLGYITRFDKYDADNQPVRDTRGKISKSFRPLIWARNGEAGKEQWKMKGFDTPHPLYGLDLLARDKQARVLIVSGEKCADAANKVLQGKGWVAITWQHGDGAKDKSDWEPVKGRDLTYWPDNDQSCKKAMVKIQDNLGGSILRIPTDEKSQGWDIADAISEGWTADDVLSFISKVEPTGQEQATQEFDSEDRVIPSYWTVSNDRGIREIKVDKEGGLLFLDVCQNAAYLSKYLRNVDKQTEKAEVKYLNNGKVQSVICPCSTLYNRATVIKLTDHGLRFTSETAKQLVRYFGAYSSVNEIPLCQSIARLGWVGKDIFFPYCDDIVYEDDSGIGLNFYEATRPRGDFKEWTERIGEICRNDDVRFVVAASLASPLIHLLRHRVFFIHIWGDSKSGKTAADKAALSVWGDPDSLMSTFNSTAVGLEMMCGTLHHLPFVIDERQVLNDKRLSPENIIYTLGEGRGRTRGNRTGGLQDVPTWENIILTNGEEPLTSDSSQQGSKTRTIEIYVKPFDDPEMATMTHQFVKDNHGTAGAVFIEGVKTRDVRADYSEIYEFLKKSGAECEHVQNVAVVCLGDWYGRMFLWKEEAEAAFFASIGLGVRTMVKINAEDRSSVRDSSWEFVKGWIIANRESFSGVVKSVQRYGDETAEEIRIIPEILNSALKDGGYSPRKTAKDLGDGGQFLWTVEGGKTRYSIYRFLDGVRKRMYVVPKKVLDDGEPDGEEKK